MPFDWETYLRLAEFLNQGGFEFSDEAAYRCAASRAYFAAFCHARNFARDRQRFQPMEEAEDHGRLRAHFRLRNMRHISEDLDELRQHRNVCDYQDEVADTAARATLAIDRARNVIRRLS